MVGKIHRSAAFLGFIVQRGANFDIVADVGNRHHQPVAAALALLGVHRIVKVARILAVNGHQRQLTQVHPALTVARGRLPVFGGLGQRGFGKFMRNRIVQQRGRNDQLRIHLPGQWLDDVAIGKLLAGRPVIDANAGMVAHRQPGGLDLFRLHGNRLVQVRLARLDVVLALLQLHLADQLGLVALEHLHDPAHQPAPAVGPTGTHLYGVAMKHQPHFLFTQGQIRQPFEYGPAGPGGVGLDGGGQQVLFGQRAVALRDAIAGQQLAVAHHGGQAA